MVEKLNKVFVTGGTGFIGTKLVAELVRKGHIVHVLRRPTSHTEELEHERIHLFTGDLMNSESIRKRWRDEWPTLPGWERVRPPARKNLWLGEARGK